VGVTNVNVSVLRHAERAHGAGSVLVITIAEEVIHGTDTGIAGVDEDVYSIHREHRLDVSASCPSVSTVYHRLLEHPVPPSSMLPMCHIKYVPLGHFTEDLGHFLRLPMRHLCSPQSGESSVARCQ